MKHYKEKFAGSQAERLAREAEAARRRAMRQSAAARRQARRQAEAAANPT